MTPPRIRFKTIALVAWALFANALYFEPYGDELMNRLWARVRENPAAIIQQPSPTAAPEPVVVQAASPTAEPATSVTAVPAVEGGEHSFADSPIGAVPEQIWLDRLGLLRSGFLAALILAAAYGLGTRIMRPLVGTGPDMGPAAISSAVGLGLGVLAYVLLLLSLAGRLSSFAAWTLLTVGLAAVPWTLLARARTVLRRWTESSRRWPVQERLGLGILALFLSGSLIGGLLPPFAADTVRHSARLAAEVADTGRLSFTPILHFASPPLVELLMAWSIVLSTEINAGLLVNGAAGVLASLTIYQIGKETFGAAAGLLAAVLFASIPMVWYGAWWGKSDLTLYLYVALALFSLLRWQRTQAIGWPLLAGIFAGLAAFTKYLGLYVAAGVAASAIMIALLARHATTGRGGGRRKLAAFVVALVLVATPWYARNYAVAGNPIWPLYFDVLGGRQWNAYAAAQTEGEFLSYDELGSGPLALATGIVLAYLPQYVQWDLLGVGPWFLIATPLIILRRTAWASVWPLATFGLTYYVGWFISSQYGRYLHPAVLSVAAPTAAALLTTFAKDPVARRVFLVALAGWIGISAAGMADRILWASPTLLGLQGTNAFLSETTWFYDEMQWMNEHLPSDAIVLSDSQDLYYLERRAIWATRHGQGWVDYSQVTRPSELMQIVQELGVTHFLYTDRALINFDDDQHTMRRDFLERHGELLYANCEARVTTSLQLGTADEIPVALFRIAEGAGRQATRGIEDFLTECRID